MNKTAILTTAAAGLLAAAGMFAAATVAKDDEPVAQSTATVWVDGHGQSVFAEKVNKMHAAMEGKGWKFGNLAVYVEDGDMQGAFVTYVR